MKWKYIKDLFEYNIQLISLLNTVRTRALASESHQMTDLVSMVALQKHCKYDTQCNATTMHSGHKNTNNQQTSLTTHNWQRIWKKWIRSIYNNLLFLYSLHCYHSQEPNFPSTAPQPCYIAVLHCMCRYSLYYSGNSFLLWMLSTHFLGVGHCLPKWKGRINLKFQRTKNFSAEM